jgi:hypothetical protein
MKAHLHAVVFQSVAGVWLPIEIAVAHYGEVDALGASPPAFEMGRERQMHAQAIVAPIALRSAKLAGVTSWTLFSHWKKIVTTIIVRSGSHSSSTYSL